MDAELVTGPLREMIVEIAGGIAECRENKYFSIGAPVFVIGCRLDLTSQHSSQFAQLDIAFDGYPCCPLVQSLESTPVLPQVMLPAINVELVEPIAPSSADGKFLILLVLVRSSIYFVVLAKLPPLFDPSFQVVHLLEDAAHGQCERVDGAFQSLQEVDTHHADQPTLTVALVEAQPLPFLLQVGCVFQILRRHIDGQPEISDLLVQVVV